MLTGSLEIEIRMNRRQLEQLAARLQSGELPLAEFIGALTAGTTADLGDTQLDLDRTRRCGYPEVVYAEGKPVDSVVRILKTLHDSGEEGFATRVNVEQADAVRGALPQVIYNPVARTLRVPAARGESASAPVRSGRVTIVSAGTTDAPVAEEARETALWMGAEVTLIQDVGVAGPHRLPARLAELRAADAIVVVAGMEGALPSVVGGYVSVPVVAVPTSVGYGASLGGIAALLSMLNSCAANVTVVNIDAGFKAAYVAGLIARSASSTQPKTESGNA